MLDRKTKMDKAVKEYMDSKKNGFAISLGTLREKYGFKRSTISKYIKLAGGIVENHTTAIRFNSFIFNEIDTEEKAYWLGFIFADGCCTKNYSVEIGIIKSDISHLEKYKTFLEIDNKYEIKTIQNMCRMRICNKTFWNDLVSKGSVERKSKILEFPNLNIFKCNSLIRHFIRGYFDGDGCIRFYKNKKGSTVCDLSFVGTYMFLKEVKRFLNASGGGLYKIDKNGFNENLATLSYRCVSARQVSRILYEGSTIHLDRKYEVYKTFCRFEEEFSNVKSSKIGESWNANTELIL